MLSLTAYNPRQLTFPCGKLPSQGGKNSGMWDWISLGLGGVPPKTTRGWDLFLMSSWKEHLCSFWLSSVLLGHLPQPPLDCEFQPPSHWVRTIPCWFKNPVGDHLTGVWHCGSIACWSAKGLQKGKHLLDTSAGQSQWGGKGWGVLAHIS